MPRTIRDPFDKVRKAAFALPLVTEGTSWGAPALKVRGKMFCCRPTHRSAEPHSLVVRLQFIDRDFLLRSRPDLYYVKPHYLDYPCVLVRLPGIRQKELRELLEISVEYVGGKRRRT